MQTGSPRVNVLGVGVLNLTTALGSFARSNALHLAV
jgi:hypothetical protein